MVEEERQDKPGLIGHLGLWLSKMRNFWKVSGERYMPVHMVTLL